MERRSDEKPEKERRDPCNDGKETGEINDGSTAEQDFRNF